MGHRRGEGPPRAGQGEVVLAEGLGLAPAEGAVSRILEGPCAGMRVFARHAMPGERLRVRLDRVRRRHALGTVVEVLAPSPERRAVDCSAAPRCGGCAWRHVDPAMQHQARGRFVLGALGRIFEGLPELRFRPHPAPGGGRMRTRMLLDAGGLGLRAYHGHEVVAPRHCPALDPRLEALRPRIATWLLDRGLSGSSVLLQLGLLPGTGTWGAFASVRPPGRVGRGGVPPIRELPDILAGLRVGSEASLGATSLEWPLSVRGRRRRIRFPLGGFSQPDAFGNGLLVAEVSAALDALPRPPRRGLDLYAGAGNLSLAWPSSIEELVAVERDRAAITLVRHNVSLGLRARTVRGDLREGLPSEVAGGASIPEVVLLDPPREGARAVCADLAGVGPEHVVYVSCDPATLARDVGPLAEAGYRPRHLAAVDLFPATPHVETVLLLSRSGRRS